MRPLARHLALVVVATLGCGDDAPVGVPTPCTDACVESVDLAPSLLALTPGQSASFDAQATTADGHRVAVAWSSLNPTLAVEADGRVTAVAPGRGWIIARAATDRTKHARSEVWVVDPDTSSQPLIAAFHDAVSGAPLTRWKGFAGRDSVRLTLSYALGVTTATDGPPALRFEVRQPGATAPLVATTVPIAVRGRGAVVSLTVHLTKRDSGGVRVLPSGAYDFFVLLPLVDGRLLGSETGYRVTF